MTEVKSVVKLLSQEPSDNEVRNAQNRGTQASGRCLFVVSRGNQVGRFGGELLIFDGMCF